MNNWGTYGNMEYFLFTKLCWHFFHLEFLVNVSLCSVPITMNDLNFELSSTRTSSHFHAFFPSKSGHQDPRLLTLRRLEITEAPPLSDVGPKFFHRMAYPKGPTKQHQTISNSIKPPKVDCTLNYRFWKMVNWFLSSALLAIFVVKPTISAVSQTTRCVHSDFRSAASPEKKMFWSLEVGWNVELKVSQCLIECEYFWGCRRVMPGALLELERPD